ncbi:uncharacterized protein PFL1_02069 [Pseudozyma flocculosa PF-1]|uniref:uncharacterized protein n=1 Tax=Pseudozyma flocculosa PF-1 TaxID=1277687 RepID=UPI0004561AE5|nr:uncharacterized protein PFL1_02069 [Pseudozyma flocculosa PF-1]EPQ30544.1 hypothetical protein PFL1_02069 [Pseudozyma flocculosa PF-1]
MSARSPPPPSSAVTSAASSQLVPSHTSPASTSVSASSPPPPPRSSAAADPQHPSTAISSTAATPAHDTKKVSCLECRASKVKCSGGSTCSRCKRLKRSCEYRSHKRGRKSDNSKIQRLESTVSSLTHALNQINAQYAGGRPPSQVHPPAHYWHQPAPSAANALASNSRSPHPHNQPGTYPHQQQAPRSPQQHHHDHHRHRHHHAQQNSSADHASRSASCSSSIATPTAEDPDQPDNLGLPTLSNPLKLLAQASDSARDRDLLLLQTQSSSLGNRPSPSTASRKRKASINAARPFHGGHGSGGDDDNDDNDDDHDEHCHHLRSRSQEQHHTRPPRNHASPRSMTLSTHPSSSTRPFGPARGKNYFANGLYVPKLDLDPLFDPIAQRVLDHAQAARLFDFFMLEINPQLTLLDPHLHTFAHVRNTSLLLLSATCWIAAKFLPDCAKAATELEARMRDVLLPSILLDGYRSAEIAQAFIILATYHPPTDTLAEDRSWTYIGFGIRVASELDMNSNLLHLPPARAADENLARRLRNRERTWLNLWLSETSLSQHMGRRPTLAIDPVVKGCRHWHLDQFALPEDKAIVAVVQLRLLLSRNIELFDTLDVALPPPPSRGTCDERDRQRTRSLSQLDFFRRTISTDLDSWLAIWTDRHVPSPSSSHSNPAVATSADGAPQRLKKAKLYYWYARLMLNTLPLKCSHLPRSALLPVYRDAYLAATSYLDLFLTTMVPHNLRFGHNSTIVTPTYCAIFALRLVSSSSAAAAANSDNRGQRQGSEVDVEVDAEAAFELVSRYVGALEEAGNVTAHRQGAAGSYAPYLQTVLARVRDSVGRSQRQQQQQQHPQSRFRPSTVRQDGVDIEMTERAQAFWPRSAGEPSGLASTNDELTNTGPQTPYPAVVATAFQAGQGGTPYPAFADSDDPILHNLFHFQAGPSGVQTVSSQPTNGSGVTDISYAELFNSTGDFVGLEEGLLNESIFGDMSLPFDGSAGGIWSRTA